MRIETSTNEKTGMVTAKIEHTGMTVQIGIDGRVFIRPADGADTLYVCPSRNGIMYKWVPGPELMRVPTDTF